VPLRSNAKSLVTGAPIAALRHRLKGAGREIGCGLIEIDERAVSLRSGQTLMQRPVEGGRPHLDTAWPAILLLMERGAP
jgi:hypothetical protein